MTNSDPTAFRERHRKFEFVNFVICRDFFCQCDRPIDDQFDFACFALRYRAADGCASPHLSIGAIVRAGLEGIRADLPTPPIYDGDPTLLSDAELEKHGLRRLPTSLEAALQAFEGDATVSGWFDATFRQAYTSTKRAELKLVEGMDPDTQCQRYAEVY